MPNQDEDNGNTSFTEANAENLRPVAINFKKYMKIEHDEQYTSLALLSRIAFRETNVDIEGGKFNEAVKRVIHDGSEEGIYRRQFGGFEKDRQDLVLEEACKFVKLQKPPFCCPGIDCKSACLSFKQLDLKLHQAFKSSHMYYLACSILYWEFISFDNTPNTIIMCSNLLKLFYSKVDSVSCDCLDSFFQLKMPHQDLQGTFRHIREILDAAFERK